MSKVTVSELLQDLERATHAAELLDLTPADGWRTRSEWMTHLGVGHERLTRMIVAARDAGIISENQTFRMRSDGQLYRATVVKFHTPGDTDAL
jgi:hypothetical protein